MKCEHDDNFKGGGHCTICQPGFKIEKPKPISVEERAKANELFDNLYGQPREDLNEREMRVICEFLAAYGTKGGSIMNVEEMSTEICNDIVGILWTTTSVKRVRDLLVAYGIIQHQQGRREAIEEAAAMVEKRKGIPEHHSDIAQQIRGLIK